MNTKDLRWFRVIYECRSITRASDRLFVSQQGLSKCIQNLEQQLDVVLFRRNHNGVEPTHCGRLLYEKSASILNSWENLALQLKSISHIEHGFLRMCSAYGVLRILSPDFIFDFNQKFHGNTIDYMEYPDLHVDQEMIQGNFDVALHIEDQSMDGFVSIPLFSSEISLLVYDEHPLAKKEKVSFTDLKGEPMIIESAAFYIHHKFRRECQKHGFEPNIIFNTSGFSLCHRLCKQKRGLSLVVDRISQDMTQEGLKRIPFDEKIEWSVALIYRKEFKNYEIIREFEEYTINWCRTLS